MRGGIIVLNCIILGVGVFDSLVQRILFDLFVIASVFVGSTNIRFCGIARFVLLFVLLYFCIDYGAVFGLGFHVDDIFSDVFSILFATTTNEAETFLKNIILGRPFRLILSVLTFIFSLIYFSFVCKAKNKNIIKRKFIYWTLCYIVIWFFLMLSTSFVGGRVSVFVSKIPGYIEQIENSVKVSEERKKFKWDAASKIANEQIVVIILGETTRGDHMSICGYSRETTPLLSTCGVVAFKDSISIGNHTLLSTPYMLTRKRVDLDNINKLFPETSIISAFKEAGFKTYYLSYLRSIHVGDSAINQIVSEADVYIKRKSGQEEDSLFLPIVDDVIKNDKSDKKMIMIKLIGSHFNYQDRYPVDFDYFKPSFKTEEYSGFDLSKKQVFLNTYDNSILHTDYVVYQIIQKLQSSGVGDVSLAFISDHGTNIMEDGKRLYGGFVKGNYNAAMFYWLGESVKERLKNNLDMFYSNINKPVDSTYFVDTVLTLSGIVTSKKVGKDLFIHEVDALDNRKVVVGDKVRFYRSLE